VANRERNLRVGGVNDPGACLVTSGACRSHR
jgi:hypothetical protein